MYENFNVNLPYNPMSAYLYTVFLILLGLVNVLIGLGNFNVIFKNKSDLVYKIGMFLGILSFVTTGLVVSNMIKSMTNPIYNLGIDISN